MSRSVSRRRTASRCVRSTPPWFEKVDRRARALRRLFVERLEDRRLLSVYAFDHVLKELMLGLPDGSTERVLLSGTASMFADVGEQGQAEDTDDDGLDQVATKLLALNLTGTSSVGPVQVTLDPQRPSEGEIEETVQKTAGSLDVPPFGDYPADSFFDVFVQVEIGGQLLHTAAPEHMVATLNSLPSAPGDTYFMTGTQPLQLLAANGKPTGFGIVGQQLTLEPQQQFYAFRSVQKELVWRFSDGSIDRVLLSGTATVAMATDMYGTAADADGDGLDEVPTELLQLDLAGTSSKGPVQVRLHPAWPATGQIEELANHTPGVLDLPPFTAAGMADSFFDVFVEIELDGTVYQSATAEHLQAVITAAPAAPGETYATLVGMTPIDLLDVNGNLAKIQILRERIVLDPAPMVEYLPFVQKELVLRLPSGATERVLLAGTAAVRMGTDDSGWAADTDGDGLDQVPVEFVELNLNGNSSQGPVWVGLGPGGAVGQIEERVNNTPGTLDLPPFTETGVADSFFDVWPEIMIGEQYLRTAVPERLETVLTQFPPLPGQAYSTPANMAPIALLDEGQTSGYSIVSQWVIPNPEWEVDQFPFARKELVLQLPNGATERVLLHGTATIEVGIDSTGIAADSDADGRDQVPAELTELHLVGTSSLGPVVVGLNPREPSLGEIEELVNNTPGTLDLPPFTATGAAFSFFDVFLQVDIGGTVLVSAEPERLRAVITHKPAAPGETYSTPPEMSPIPLVDPDAWYYDGQANGTQYPEIWIVSERLVPIPTGRIRVVKDAQPDDAQDFVFVSPELGNFVLDDDSDPTRSNSRIFSNLAPGIYTVKEPLVAGWNLASIVIDDPDGDGAVDLSARTATIDLDPGENITVTFTNLKNQPPVADAGGPYVVAEGGSVQLSALDSDDDVGIVRYEWDFDSNGTYDHEGPDPTVTFSAADWDGPANVPVTLRVTDDEEASDTTTTLIHVRNAAPTVSDLALTSPIDEGDVATLSGTVTDPAPDDELTLEVNWGEGLTQIIPLDDSLPPGVTYNPATGAFTVQHTYLDDGPSPGNATASDLYAVTGRVVDDDGGWSPLVQPVGPRIANEDNDSGWTVTQQIQAGEPIGQTFTAISNNRLDTISFYVADMNEGVAEDYSLTFELYEGIGTSGRLLGRREYTGLSDGFSGFIAADFSSVTLLDGQMYTATLSNDTARWGRVAIGNQYAGGTALYADAPSPTADALFIIQWQPDAQPPRLANDDNDTGWTVTQQIQAGEPIGQTFAAISDNRLDTISFYVADMNASVAPTDYSLTFELYEGIGTSGRLLGRREYTGLSDGFSGFIAADFSSVTLLDGQMYTAVLVNDTARWGRVACGNQYAGGTALYADSPSPTSDALFIVQWQRDGQPPPLANDDNDTGWTVTQQIQAGEPIGQTFTAISDNRLDTISFYVSDMNASVAPTDYSLTFELYEGIGTSGRLLGRREYVGLSDGFSGFIAADFSSVTLVDGDMYTAVLTNDTARWGRVACGNQYAGGTALYAGSPSPTSDALFVVQWQPDSSAPEIANDDNDTGWSVTQQIQAGEPIGQTFTAISDNRLDTISFYVADMNAGVAADYSIEFALYEGVGTGGRLLGRREYTGLSDDFKGFVSVDFSAVTLVDGGLYTAVLTNDTQRWGRVACGNQYAGGTALYADSPSPTADALFRVTWQPDGPIPQLANDDNDTGWTVTQQIQAGEPIGQT
ncbi:MAG TPA: PKD domain-containing protein, partial [Candidatus Anammoximicrobium sp.]|nr:PKD domain-containing protein [Candidatus Anammoximicrobium sp.]